MVFKLIFDLKEGPAEPPWLIQIFEILIGIKWVLL